MTLPQLSPDFDRTTGIGASEVGALLGLSPWKSPYSLWAEKTGQVGQDPTSPAMEWGLRLQDAVLGAYADRHGLTLGTEVRRNQVTRRKGRLFATPDAFLMAPTADGTGHRRAATVDAKTTRSSDGWGEDGSDTVPPAYYAQAQVQAHVFGLDRCDLAVLIGGTDFRTYAIPADPAVQDRVIHAVDTWWETHVAGRTPPPITQASDDTERTLRSLFPGRQDDTLTAGADLDPLVTNLVQAYLNRQQVTAAYDLARQQVEAAMGDHTRLEASRATITWTRAKDSEVTAWDQVAASLRKLVMAMAASTGYQVTDPDLEALGLRLRSLGGLGGLEGLLDAVESLYTTTKPGSRRFLVKPTSTED